MKRLCVGNPIAVENLEMIPIQLISMQSDRVGNVLVALAAKEPVAIVIRSRRHIWALDLEGRDASLDNLLRDVDGLRDWVQ